MSTQQPSPEMPAQLAALRNLGGASAGAMFTAVWQEYAAVKASHQGDRSQVVSDLIGRLHASELITTADVKQLRYVADGVFAKTRGDLSAAALSGRIRSTHDAVAADTNSSQVAVAVLSVLAESNAMATQAQPTAAAPAGPGPQGDEPEFVPNLDPSSITLLSSNVPTMVADEGIILEGAMLGAGAGGLLGGPVGGVLGGLLGTIIGGFIAVIDAIT
jgi:hypothetical protein